MPSADIDTLYDEARHGNRRALGRLLTKVERGGPEADRISDLTHNDAGSAHILGFTGAPGAGKSTLVGQVVKSLVEGGANPAILAVDPSSPLTGGAILGDRIRMDDVVDPSGQTGRSSFIRSMATRGHSGGLALAVPLAVRLFDAAGYNPVIIETVGVGQVEVDVVSAADTAVVVMTPGMGDSVQANKAGLLEVADVFVVNKADRPGANEVKRDLNLMLDLSHVTGQESATGYRPPIIMTTALDGTGADDVLEAVSTHLDHLMATGGRDKRRSNRIRSEVTARLMQRLTDAAEAEMASDAGRSIIAKAEDGSTAPTEASDLLAQRLLGPPS